MRRYIILFLLLLTACGTPATVAPPPAAPAAATAAAQPNPCGEDALKAYRNTYNSIIDRWGDVVIKAGQADGDALGPSIDSMKKLAAELAQLPPPTCAKQAHSESQEAMQLAIKGYETRLAQNDVGSTIRDSIDQLASARAKVGALPGTPPPTPTLGPTVTPLPTYTPLPTITPTHTPVPTATPAPRQGVITSKSAQVFETATSTQPVKTLLRGASVMVFEAQKGRLHIRTAGVEGWISQSAVVMR